MPEEKCLDCERPLVHVPGSKKKKFCNDKCRQSHWQKKKPKDLKMKLISVEEYNKLMAQIVVNNDPKNKERILAERTTPSKVSQDKAAALYPQPAASMETKPPPPVRQAGEDVFDFAARKNEYKRQYGG